MNQDSKPLWCVLIALLAVERLAHSVTRLLQISLCKTAEFVLDQNNTLDLMEEYFSEPQVCMNLAIVCNAPLVPSAGIILFCASVVPHYLCA